MEKGNIMKSKQLFKELMMLSFATLIISAAVFFFLVPSHAAVSSVSGLAIVIRQFVKLPISVITMILNISLLIIGFFTVGKEFGYKTVYTSILLPLFIGMFEMLFPHFTSFTHDALLDVVCYIFVVSIGLAILFNMNASSGGIDIIAKIMNVYFHVELGKAVSIAGLLISFSSLLAYDSKTVILSLLGSYLNGIVLDHFIFDQNMKKRVCIVSPKIEEIRDFILNELHSGASIYKCIGAYHGDVHDEIVCITDKAEFRKLMNFVHEIDEDAFITVYKVANMQYRSKVLEEKVF